MFDSIAEELRRGNPIATWRRTLATRESTISRLLVEAGERFSGVLVGSYPMFDPGGPHVELVLKSSDEDELRAAVAWLEPELERVVG
jgi:hypothetical protein